jgi:hypothetical protein
LEEEGHLNALFAHFICFSREFELLLVSYQQQQNGEGKRAVVNVGEVGIQDLVDAMDTRGLL